LKYKAKVWANSPSATTKNFRKILLQYHLDDFVDILKEHLHLHSAQL